MRRSEAKSHRVGRATLGTGAVTTAYRAVVACACLDVDDWTRGVCPILYGHEPHA